MLLLGFFHIIIGENIVNLFISLYLKISPFLLFQHRKSAFYMLVSVLKLFIRYRFFFYMRHKNGLRVYAKPPTVSMVRDIRVGVKTKASLLPEWEEACINACLILSLLAESEKSAVRFRWVGSTSDDATISVSSKSLQESILASAKIGTYLGVGNEICINAKQEQILPDEMCSIIQHELLHTLGLFHTGSLDGVMVAGTSGFLKFWKDSSSIMMPGTDVMLMPRRLSRTDIEALATLFPDDE
jgi:hypothetical protein